MERTEEWLPRGSESLWHAILAERGKQRSGKILFCLDYSLMREFARWEIFERDGKLTSMVGVHSAMGSGRNVPRA